MGTSRSLVCNEGGSNKFWTLELDGTNHKIHFGKVGSAGQKKIKRFKDAAAAKKDFDAMVAEKLKKGYVDAGGKAPKASSSKVSSTKASTAKASTTKASSTSTSTTKSVDESITKSIALGENDYLWATWRKRKSPQKMPDPRPFDRDACLEILASLKQRRYGWEWDFSKANLSLAMSKEEARFWFECMQGIERDHTPKQRADQLKKKKLGPLTPAGAVKLLKKSRNVISETVLVLTVMFGADAVTEMLITDKPGSDGWVAGGTFFEGWHTTVLPLLDESSREALKKAVRSKITPANFPTDSYEEPSGEFLVAASLGLHDELLKVVESWTDDRYTSGEDWADSYHVPQIMIFGLGSADLVSKHMRRLSLRVRFPDYVRAWIAHTEYDGLDWVAKTIVETKNKDDAAKLAEVLALVHAPENAGPMLEIATRSKAPKVGAEWLDEHVGCAAAGLASVASGRGALATAAQEKLRGLKRAGYTHLIPADAAVLKEAPEKVLPKMSAPPKWMADALTKAQKLKVPAWIDAAQLPPLEADGKTLDLEHVNALVAALGASVGAMQPLVQAIREHATVESRDAFAWRLFESWLTEGAPSKEKWALCAMGWLGGNQSALKLAPMVRAWPGESQHARAVVGLDVLRNIGTDTALMQLSGIAAKVKFQALKTRAGEAMNEIAKSRKMSRDDLEDRIVPDGGFDESGKLVLDFGGRKFHVVLGSEGAPMVRDEAGVRKSDLPKAGSKDDAKLAEKAHAEWKLLKKTLREVTKIQTARLEQAMVKGRTWKAQDFETLIVKHPLLSHFARGLVFGSKKDTFRVAEDGSYADAKDGKYTLPKDGLVRIMHPLDMADALKAAWGQVFSDYEILPPFQQLGRQTFTIDDKEKKAADLSPRFKGQEWGVSAFIGKLARRGWVHGHPQDAGFVNDHSKPFFSAGITAVVEHTGYPIGSRDWADAQKIEKLFFVKGTEVPVPWSNSKKALKLADVDKKALSEVLLDLT